MKNILAYFSVIAFVVSLIFGAGKLLAESKQTASKVEIIEARVTKVEDKSNETKEKVEKLDARQEAIKEDTENIEEQQAKIETKIDQIVTLLLEAKQKGESK